MTFAWVFLAWWGRGRGLRSQGSGGLCITVAALCVLDKSVKRSDIVTSELLDRICHTWEASILSALELQPPSPQSLGFVFAFQPKPCRNAFYLLHTEEQQPLLCKG